MTKHFIIKLKEDQEVGIQSHEVKDLKKFEGEKGKREKKVKKLIERHEKKGKKAKFKDHLLKGKYQVIETDLTLEELQADPDIESVEEDHKYKHCAQDIHWGHGSDFAGTKLEYHAKGLTGAGVKVVIADSGINYDHEDLIGKVKGGAKILDGVVISQNVPSDYKDTPEHGHGTLVASAIASSDNSVGVLGSAPGVDLYSYKITAADKSTSSSSIVKALELAVDNGMHVFNLSYGGMFSDYAWQDACEYAYANNVSVLVAGGNEYTYVNGLVKAFGVLGIGAAHRDVNSGYELQIADYSGRGEVGISFVGPANVKLASAEGNNTYMEKAPGTSFATPFVAGVVAILRQKFPGIHIDQIKHKLQQTAMKIPDGGDPYSIGHGFIRPVTDTLPRRVFVEDFEDDAYQSEFKGDWTRVSHSTGYALTNKVIPDYTVSSMKFNVLAGRGGILRFKYLVSTQADKDFFRIYRNGEVHLKTSGQLGSNWLTFDLPLVPEFNKIELRYTKDTAGTAGKDRILIDSIELIGPARFF